eukprot:TRINITY_DN14265_c0_g1_i3.p1 TRINITY_DN14265_c0_g1~~TRINITY_DN14265_c0_g1_i3.p1  ORF type:complete len:232 (-),score=64.38 TRINITY_DN14265_c0_g1_i3:327-1022(-)
MKGKSVRQEFDRRGAASQAQGFESVRPNPNQYKENFDEEREKHRQRGPDGEEKQTDYQEYAYRAPESEEFDNIRDSFQTIHDIKDIKFRPDDVDLPDPSLRFNLDERVKNKVLSDRSHVYMLMVLGMLGGVFFYLNRTQNAKTKKNWQTMIYNILNKEEYDEYFQTSQEEKEKSISANIKAEKEYLEYEKKLEEATKKERNFRAKVLPEFKPFITSKNMDTPALQQRKRTS